MRYLPLSCAAAPMSAISDDTPRVILSSAIMPRRVSWGKNNSGDLVNEYSLAVKFNLNNLNKNQYDIVLAAR